MRWILAWLGVGGAFGVLDGIWLSQMFERLYKPALGALLAPGLRLDAATGVEQRDRAVQHA